MATASASTPAAYTDIAWVQFVRFSDIETAYGYMLGIKPGGIRRTSLYISRKSPFGEAQSTG